MKDKNGRELKIIDAHAHIFPQKIAEKATKNIGNFYGISMKHTGLSHLLIESGEKIGVSRYLVCSTATKPEQVEMINNFVAEKCRVHPEFFGFGTMHPGYGNMETEIERVKELGLHGIKLHPDFQEFNIDDPAALPMYEAIAASGLPILFHTGDKFRPYSAPHRLAAIARQFPKLTCIAAHFGGYNNWNEAAGCLYDCPNVYFDTSSTLFALDPARAVGMIDHFGDDRFLFGTDFPMWDHVQELERFLNLNLSDERSDKILYQNFEKLFKIQI
ncbi:amidohydrolase family protein [Anaerotruncus rubiinfantis]|uniref:amidohydrolase family protein n=1 Tax=Anaerotruncus rubiinfantis TaxID=1720200 RepID=UPI00082C1B97|nr:amidohydrolase family protein [Anaerotruncus rubiinfantis]